MLHPDLTHCKKWAFLPWSILLHTFLHLPLVHKLHIQEILTDQTLGRYIKHDSKALSLIYIQRLAPPYWWNQEHKPILYKPTF